MRTTNTASIPKSRLQTNVPEPNGRHTNFPPDARVCYAHLLLLPGGGRSGEDEHREAKERRRVKDFLLGRELGFGRPRWGCRTRRPRSWESSVMSVHSVMRTLRKNKTLRYGVPMLVSAGGENAWGGIPEGAGRPLGRSRRSRSGRQGAGSRSVGGEGAGKGWGRGWRQMAVLVLYLRSYQDLESPLVPSLVVTGVCFRERGQNQILPQVWVITELTLLTPATPGRRCGSLEPGVFT